MSLRFDDFGVSMRILFLVVLLFQWSCGVSQGPEAARRRPLEKNNVALKTPKERFKQVISTDPTTGKTVYHDPKARILPVDEKAGKYEFRWIGHDGKEKVIEYQRADAVDVVVVGSVRIEQNGEYLYDYQVQSLPSSSTYLHLFAVQNFSSEVIPSKIGDNYVGHMLRDIPQFSTGNWLAFFVSESEVNPGQKTEARLTSPSPAGLVECRVAGGPLMLKGVGEDMPTELEMALPGYEEYPKGYTIGPIDSLKTSSRLQRVEYILSHMEQFKRLGWVTTSARGWYQTKLKDVDVATLTGHLQKDLDSEQITSEVFDMMRTLLVQ